MPSDKIKLNGIWWRIATDKNGTPIYAQRPVPFFPPQISQVEVTEAQFPPEARVPYSFRDLSEGAGQSETPITGVSQSYDRIGDVEGEGVDASLSPHGPMILGPLLSDAIADAAVGGTNYFYGAFQKTIYTAYFGYGQFVYQWQSYTATQVGDLGGGNQLTSPIVQFRGSQTQNYWYAPLGNNTTPKYSTDSGVTWTAITTSGGLDKVASMVVIDGRAVVAMASPRQGSAMVAQFDDGGTTPTIFGVIDPVGDPANAIDRLIVYNNRVFCAKAAEGLFLLTSDRNTLEQNLFENFAGLVVYPHGMTIWRGLLLVPTSLGLFAIGPGFGTQLIVPTRTGGGVAGNVAMAVSGTITAVAGDAHHLYAYLNGNEGNIGASTAPAWLLKGNVVVSGSVQRAVFHPILFLGTQRYCSTMTVVSHRSADVGGRRVTSLLLDYYNFQGLGTFGNAGVKTIRLPGKGSDPRSDTGYRYCAAGTLYYSRLTARFPFANKTFFGVTPLFQPLHLALDGITATTALTGRNRYKLDSTAFASVSPFGFTQGAAQTTGVGVRDAIALRGRGLDVAMRLTTADSTLSPQLQSLTVDYDVEPSVLWRHEFTLNIGEGSTIESGATLPDPMTPAKAISLLRVLPGSGSITFVDLWNNAYNVTVPISGGMAIRPAGPGEEGAHKELPIFVDLLAIEQLAFAQGTYDALTSTTYGSLNSNGYAYSALSSL